jgi:hypothetical protein
MFVYGDLLIELTRQVILSGGIIQQEIVDDFGGELAVCITFFFELLKICHVKL